MTWRPALAVHLDIILHIESLGQKHRRMSGVTRPRYYIVDSN